MKKVDLIVDLQFGSTGKGLIAGYLGMEWKPDVVVNANMPNAGHTYIDHNGDKMVFKVLPNSCVSPLCRIVLIGPGSVFSIDRLAEELDQLEMLGYRNFRVGIHPNAVILNNEHMLAEEKLRQQIGSTGQGSMAAQIDKMQRYGGKVLASHYNMDIINRCYGLATVLTHNDYRRMIEGARHIVAEGAQGFSLGLNQEFWPFCTSRECTPARFMSDMGIPLSMLNHVIGVARVHPIRVGGNSGPCYDDQHELSWTDVGQPPELTTVTKKVRRIFTFSYQQMNQAIWECEPTDIFLNFCNYDEEMAKQIVADYQEHITWMGYGPTHFDVKRIRGHIG